MFLRTHYRAGVVGKHQQAYWYFGFQPRVAHPRRSCGFKLSAGRGSQGSRTVLSKGSCKGTAVHRVLTALPDTRYRLTLVTSFHPARMQASVLALLYGSFGTWAFVPARAGLPLFGYLRVAPARASARQAGLAQSHWWWALSQLEPLARVSNLFTVTRRRYASALGSVATLLAPCLWGSWALVLLPSGRLFFSPATATVSLGSNESSQVSLTWGTRAGYWRVRGWAPHVRGTAKNPNDHPHGGRTRAIKYPRTPWGRTAKKSRHPRAHVTLKPLAKRKQRLTLSGTPVAELSTEGEQSVTEVTDAPAEV